MPWVIRRNMTLDTTRITVVGGGHAGRGLAAYLSLQGYEVTLYNRTFQNVAGIHQIGGLHVTGVIEGFAPLHLVTDDMGAAIPGRDMILVTVPAHAHRWIAERMAPYLESGQLVLLMPGRTGGALEFSRVLSLMSCESKILLGEAQTYSFVSRTTGATSVHVSEIKNFVRVSAFPAIGNRRLLRHLRRLPLSFELADNVMETGLNNIGAMLHPAPTILSAGLLESRGGGYNHYRDAISPTVAHLIERMDAERVQVAEELSLSPVTLVEWLRESYDATGSTLYECIRNVKAYENVGSPSNLHHRYVLEDVPTGLVPIAFLGRLVGVKTPTIDTVINMACHLYERSFWREGRNLVRLGLEGLTPTEVIEYVYTGVRATEVPSIDELWSVYGMEVDEV